MAKEQQSYCKARDNESITHGQMWDAFKNIPVKKEADYREFIQMLGDKSRLQ